MCAPSVLLPARPAPFSGVLLGVMDALCAVYTLRMCGSWEAAKQKISTGLFCCCTCDLGPALRALPCAAQPRLPCPAPACEPSADCAGLLLFCSCSWSLRVCACGSASVRLWICLLMSKQYSSETKNDYLRSQTLRPEMWVQKWQQIYRSLSRLAYTCDS